MKQLHVTEEIRDKIVKQFCYDKCYTVTSVLPSGICVLEHSEIVVWDEILNYYLSAD